MGWGTLRPGGEVIQANVREQKPLAVAEKMTGERSHAVQFMVKIVTCLAVNTNITVSKKYKIILETGRILLLFLASCAIYLHTQ